jgi:hypothetical protein
MKNFIRLPKRIYGIPSFFDLRLIYYFIAKDKK